MEFNRQCEGKPVKAPAAKEAEPQPEVMAAKLSPAQRAVKATGGQRRFS